MKIIILFLAILVVQTSSYAQLFGPRQIINEEAGTVRMVRTADFDNDGDLDVVAAAANFIAWYENLNGAGQFSAPIPIQEKMGQSFNLIPVTIDSDGNIDLVVSFFDEDKVVWYRNMGSGVFAAMQPIASNLNRAGGVTAADIDQDGDTDLVLGVTNGSGLYWVENLDGQGTFGSLNSVDASLSQARNQALGDIDGDGDMDILSNCTTPYLVWYENTSGNGDFSTQHVIDAVGLYETSVNLVDMDGDADLDILSQKSDLVIWRENLNGQGNFGAFQVVSDQALNISDTDAADLDNDGDMDALSASTSDDKVAWYENTDGNGTFGSQNSIDSALPLPRTVHAADLDGDGDLDVLSASLFGEDRELVWYENLTILSIEETPTESIGLYPNPVNEILYIKNLGTLQLQTITLYDALGRKLLYTASPSEAINIAHLSSGLLFVHLVTNEGRVVRKIVKE